MTSFHAENCCHLVDENEASAARVCSRVRQFQIYGTGTFVLVNFKGFTTNNGMQEIEASATVHDRARI